jgi:Ca2+-binding EF-hand superfamily protein
LSVWQVNYIFHLYDPQGTGYIDREAMTALLRVAHFAEKDDEVMLMSFAAVVLRRY